MKTAEIVFALYKPHAGKEKELSKLIARHMPILREYDLVTERQPIVVKSKNGTFIEIFEWKNSESAKIAHDHPAIAQIWEAMGKIAAFECLKNLEEAGQGFAHFQPLN